MKKRILNAKLEILIAFILITCSFIYFHFIVPYHVFFKEQIQLFIFDSTYLSSYFSKPGGLACLTGDFLTQFLYLEGGGAIVIALLLFLEWILTFKILEKFSFNSFASLWALLPVIAEWIAYSDIYFSISMSMAFIFSISVFLIYTNVKNNALSIITGILLIPILYILTGSAIFLFLFLVPVYELKLYRQRFIYWILLLVLSIIIPYCLRSSYLLTMPQAYFYPYNNIKQETTLLIFASISFLSCFKLLRELKASIYYCSFLVFFILIAWIAGLVKVTDMNREKILGMATEAYYDNWNETLKIAEKAKLQNAIATYYANIALSKQRQLGDRLMDFYQPFSNGLFLPVNPESGWFTIFFGSDAYFYTGDMNMAQHSAMLGMIFSPYQRSSRLIHRLAEINIVTGDIPAAMKYIRIMETTLFHRKRAVKLKNLAVNSEKYPEFFQKQTMIHSDDILHFSSNPQPSLELLLEGNRNNTAALDYLLCFYLLNKNIPAFFNTYSSYIKSNNQYIPKVYAEALLIYFAATNAKPEDILEYKINSDIIRRFNEYTEIYERTNGDLKPLKEKFPDAYWLYYHFATLKDEDI